MIITQWSDKLVWYTTTLEAFKTILMRKPRQGEFWATKWIDLVDEGRWREERGDQRDLYMGFKALAEGGLALLKRRIVAVNEYIEAAYKGQEGDP
jgi:hypothetical protein